MARAAPASTRAAEIISFLTAHPLRGFTISELARHLNMNIASAHATLAVLTDCGFVVRDPAHRTYVLGPALAATGFAALERHPIIDAAIEQADVLAGELDAECSVIAQAGRDLVVLARRGPPSPSWSIGEPGDRAPLLAPLGVPFLAWADEQTVREWLARAAIGPPAADLYHRLLAQVRHHGFSVATPAISAPDVVDAVTRLRDDPTAEDAERRLVETLHKIDDMLLLFDGLPDTDETVIRAISAPVFDPIGRALLSLAICGTERPMRIGEVRRLGHRLSRAAAVATRQGRGRAPAREQRRTVVRTGE